MPLSYCRLSKGKMMIFYNLEEYSYNLKEYSHNMGELTCQRVWVNTRKICLFLSRLQIVVVYKSISTIKASQRGILYGIQFEFCLSHVCYFLLQNFKMIDQNMNKHLRMLNVNH